MTQQRQNPVKGYQFTKGVPPGQQVLEELRAVHAMVAARPTQPAEPTTVGDGCAWNPTPTAPRCRPEPPDAEDVGGVDTQLAPSRD